MKRFLTIFICICLIFVFFMACSKIQSLLNRIETNWDREFLKVDNEMKPAVKVYEEAIEFATKKINYYTDGKNEKGNYILNENFNALSDTTQQDFIQIFRLSIRADSVAKPIYKSWVNLKAKQNKTKKDVETARTYLQKLTEAKAWLKMILSISKGYIQKKF